MNYDGFSERLKKIFAARNKLFGDEHLTNMAKLLAQKLSVNDSLEAVGLSNFYKTSNFIERALKFFFSYNFASLSEQMKLLAELDNEYNDYKNIFSAVADSIIQSVYHAGSFKEQCIKIFYSRLGDPRFNNSRLNWRGVSQKSQEIFCHWLSEKDLEVFFKIIKQTALDHMWRHREKFWRAYLPHIVNTKIFLGPSARYVAANLEGVKLHYGNLQKAEDNQSIFVFQIERYIFSEWSHNGKLRIYRTNNAATNFFEYNSITRQNLTENFIFEQTHHSPKSYSWQKKISDWMLKHCNIYKTERDWGLR